MKLGFYYHIPVFVQEKSIYTSSFLGVFIDALANEVDTLYLVMHETKSHGKEESDYLLKAKNISFVSLGEKTPAWHRAIFYKRILKKPLEQLTDCDAFIVRSPSPLAPYFHKFFPKKQNLFFMIVGDYIDGAEHLKSSTFRDRLIYQFLKYNDKLFTREIRKTNVLVNSKALFEKYKDIAKNLEVIKTTTLTNNDFFDREDTCQSDKIRLVFTGRIDPAKGLFELLEALCVLNADEPRFELHVTGWEQDNLQKPVEGKMIEKAKELGIDDCLHFHGRKAVGEELNAMYRMGDLYVLPSYHEGFPRTIWEALANSLPVVASAVGGIPSYLNDNENVILIQPKSVDEIVQGIQKVISQPELRKKLIANGKQIAKENTLEVQNKAIVEKIKNRIHHA